MSPTDQRPLWDSDPAPSRPAPSGTRDRKPTKVKLDYPFDLVTSAMHKAIRSGQDRQAAYWALLLYGASAQYCWRRLLVASAEDVGFADPETVNLVSSLCAGWEASKGTAYYISPHAAVMAAMALARARKETTVDDLIAILNAEIKEAERDPSKRRPIPPEAQDIHTASGRAQGRTLAQWFLDRHSPEVCNVPLNGLIRERIEREEGLNTPAVRALIERLERAAKVPDARKFEEPTTDR